LIRQISLDPPTSPIPIPKKIGPFLVAKTPNNHCTRQTGSVAFPIKTEETLNNKQQIPHFCAALLLDHL
jgi:hypothetical protein